LLISKDSIRGILPKTLKHLLIAQPQILRRLRQFNRLLQDDQHPLPRLQRHGVLGQEAFPIKFGSDDNHGLTIGEYTLDAGGACERANNSIVRIALFGGTFDPVHYGHLRLAEEAREAAGLERVLFVPAHMSPFRQQEPLSESRHRLLMTRLAVADNPAFEASDIEIQRGGVSYTVDTVTTLRALYPDDELFLILGADALLGFPNWYRAAAIAHECILLVGVRPHYDLQAAMGHLPDEIRPRVQPVPMTPLDISASDIRQRIRAGRSIRYLTPPNVIEYIQQHRLYLEP